MRKVLIIALSLLLTAFIIMAVKINVMLNKIEKVNIVDEFTGKILDSPEEKGISPDVPEAEETGIINILLFGEDKRLKNEPARSDSIMIVSINKKNKAVKITSLMRDMYVRIPEHDDNKLNTAYFYGGPGLAIKTVNTNFKMNVEDYVAVDFFALEKVIDFVGGVPIDVKKTELIRLNLYIDNLNEISDGEYKAPHITTGGLHILSGRQAVAYCRIRHVGRDDFERTERQRKVLQELLTAGKSMGLNKILDFVDILLPSVRISLSKRDILDLIVTTMELDISELEQFRLPVDGFYTDKKINGQDVLVPDLDENVRLLHEFIYD